MPNSSRKLAAIVFTDIAGFTELSAHDELKSLKLLENQRRIFQPIVSEFGGQWLKEMGDGLLLSFESSLNAVRCAVELQMAARAVEGLALRIGIHQGPLVVGTFGSELRSDYTAIGPTVNMASRIEGACPPGEVLISGELCDLLPEDLAEDAGSFQLKGIDGERRLYRLV